MAVEKAPAALLERLKPRERRRVRSAKVAIRNHYIVEDFDPQVETSPPRRTCQTCGVGVAPAKEKGAVGDVDEEWGGGM